MKTKKDKPIKKEGINPLTFEEWLKNNPGMIDSSTLGKSNPNYYLKNRLWRAFHDAQELMSK